MELSEVQVSSELKYKGVIVNVRLDDARLCNGKTVKREVVEHPGGVTILPVDKDKNCYMVKQFRYPIGDVVLEAPAGKLERGEDHYECAVRELGEETGFTSDNIIYLGACYTSPGFSSEILHIYLALSLHTGEAHPDEDEFLNTEKYPLDKLVEMCMNAEIPDAKTCIALLKADKYLALHPELL